MVRIEFDLGDQIVAGEAIRFGDIRGCFAFDSP